MQSTKSFSVLEGRDTGAAASDWSYEKPDDLDESRGGSPRKHPPGLTFFEDRDADVDGSGAAAMDPRLSVRYPSPRHCWNLLIASGS